MPEYRRFVAYFYEYIDGKKQKNAGFAKVELRNGIWRILFRLTIPTVSRMPAQVYGFVREGEYLLGFPLGTMRMDIQQPEEWAWRADAVLGFDRYGFGQLNGIRIQSQEGRLFITVWDDEALDPDRFVLALPESEHSEQLKEMPAVTALKSSAGGPEPQNLLSEKPDGVPEPSQAKQLQGASLEVPAGDPEPKPREQPEEIPQGLPAGDPEPKPREQPEEIPQGPPAREPEPMPQEVPVERPVGIPSPMPSDLPVQPPREMPAQVPIEMPGSGSGTAIPKGTVQENPTPSTKNVQMVESLLRSRHHFQPFEDDEFSECVRIRMCDLVSLQQEGWQVGKSNFLWHGYSLYRHLLLGRHRGGGYVIGVPGVFNRQEEYVAGIFDYGHFKLSSLGGCGRRIGYWYRQMRMSKCTDATSPRTEDAGEGSVRESEQLFTAPVLWETENKEDMTWN